MTTDTSGAGDLQHALRPWGGLAFGVGIAVDPIADEDEARGCGKLGDRGEWAARL